MRVRAVCRDRHSVRMSSGTGAAGVVDMRACAGRRDRVRMSAVAGRRAGP